MASSRIILTTLLLVAWPGIAEAEEKPVGDPADPGWVPSVWLTQEYRFRHAGNAETVAGPLDNIGTGSVNDQDLRLTLDGNLVGLNGHFVGTLSGALWLDLDGRPAQDRQDVFGESPGWSRSLAVVYTASAEWRRSGPLARLLVGRQQSSHGLPVTFDGGAIDLRFLERRLTLFALGGQTVHFFQARPGLFENWLVGGGIGFRLDPNLQIEADSRFFHEIILGSAGVDGERVNTNSYGVALMGRWDDFQAKLFARGMNRTFSHVGGTFRLRLPAAGLGLDGQATAQLVTLGEIAESESPFFAVLGNSLPFLRARLETWKEFRSDEGAVVAIAVGTRLRQLLRDQPTTFNRNMNALYARLDLTDDPFKGAFASVSVDWNMPTQPGDSTRFFTVGGSAGYTARAAKAEVGTYFQRFKVNYYRDVEELTYVRTLYAMGSYRVFSHVEIRARYLVEVVDRTIQSVFLTLREDI